MTNEEVEMDLKLTDDADEDQSVELDVDVIAEEAIGVANEITLKDFAVESGSAGTVGEFHLT